MVANNINENLYNNSKSKSNVIIKITISNSIFMRMTIITITTMTIITKIIQ